MANGSQFIDEANDLRELELKAGDGDVTLNAGGAITGPDNGIDITAGTADVTITGMEMADIDIDTEVNILDAETSNGSVVVDELDGLTLNNVTAGGDGKDVTVTSAEGDITVGTVTALDDNVTLNTTDGSIVDDGDTDADISSDTANLTITGTEMAGIDIDTNINTLDAKTSNGSVVVAEADGLTLDNVKAGGNNTNDVTVTSADGDIRVEMVTAPDEVTLDATNGSIVDDNDQNTQIEADTANLTAGNGSVGTSNNEIDTQITTLNAQASNGSVVVGEANGLTLNNVTATGNGNDVTVTSAEGDITVGAVTAADEVTLDATKGSIVDDNNQNTEIAATTANLTAGDGTVGALGTNQEIDTAVDELNVDTQATNGDQFIEEQDNLTALKLEAGKGNVTLKAGGAINDADSNADISADTARLDAGTNNIGDPESRLNTDVMTLRIANSANLQNPGAGNAFIAEKDDLTLDTVRVDGIFDLIATDISTSGAINAGTDITLTADNMALNNPVTGSGNLLLQPLTANRQIGIGTMTGQLDFTVSEINNLTDGFESITIAGNSGGIQMGDSVTFKDPVTIQAPNASITQDGDIIGIGDASITLEGETVLIGSTIPEANINTANQNITINGDTNLGSNVTLNTNNGGGDILFKEGTVNGNQSLTLIADTGNILFGGAVGNFTPLGDLTINNATNVTTAEVRAANFIQLDGSGTTTFNGALDIGNMLNITTDGNITTQNITAGESIDLTSNNGNIITTAGTLDSSSSIGEAGGITLTAPNGSITSGNLDSSSSAGNAGGITLTAPNGSITSGNLDSSSSAGNAGGITFTAPNGSIIPGNLNSSSSAGNAGDITFQAANGVVLNGITFDASSTSNNGGNVTLEAGSNLSLDNSSRILVDGVGTAGTIGITSDSLTLNNQSSLSAIAAASDKNGIISLIATLMELDGNSSVTGHIQIDANRLFVLNQSRMSAVSSISIGEGFFVSGDSTVVIKDGNSTEPTQINPPELPQATLIPDLDELVVQSCIVTEEESQFIITRRGGLPPRPSESLSPEALLRFDITPESAENPSGLAVTRQATDNNSIELPQLAQGLSVNSQGDIVLTAEASNFTTPIPLLLLARGECHAP
ncbi:MAG: hypothetical protein F6K14_08400 [Symploca sp. SIO2C1]|nr:hypothetical protein [Symploca sp. SIO2C1]